MFKKLTSLSMALVISLCPLARTSHAVVRSELTAKIASILEEKDSDGMQKNEVSNDDIQDAKNLQKILKELQAREKALKEKKKAELKEKFIKCAKIAKEALLVSSALIVNGVFITEFLGLHIF